MSDGLRAGLRGVAPQLATAGRLVFGAAAIVAASRGDLFTAAAFITWGGVLDGVDGWIARMLRATSPFGALFDYFCDYVCFVLAPWMLARAMLVRDGSASWLQETLLVVPLMTSAIRYARNGMTLLATPGDAPDLPGLGTVFMAFVCVDAVFLDARALLDDPAFAVVLNAFILTFSLMMLAPIRYPKLTRFSGASPAVLVLLAIMPFAATGILAWVMLVVGVLYAVAAPALALRQAAHLKSPISSSELT